MGLDELHRNLAHPDVPVHIRECRQTGVHEVSIDGKVVGSYELDDILRPGAVFINCHAELVDRLEPAPSPLRATLHHEAFINWVRARTGRRALDPAQSGHTAEDLRLEAIFELQQGDAKTRDKFHKMGLQA